MPNRMLRDWTDSDAVNNLSVHAERFFVRLIMKADDFGCYHGDPRLLLSFLYPLISEKIKVTDISKYLTECEDQGLIIQYDVSGKKYLEIKEFRQRLRSMKSKFPRRCQTNDGQLPDTRPASAGDPQAIVSPEEEEKIEGKMEGNTEEKTEPVVDEKMGYVNDFALIPQMVGRFKKEIPEYLDSAEHDGKALISIANFLCKRAGLTSDPARHAEKILEAWEPLCAYIATDNFYCQKSLRTISNCIQEIVQKALHGDKSKSTDKKGEPKLNDDRLKAGIRDRIAQRGRA